MSDPATSANNDPARHAETIREHMEVLGDDGAHVGVVDHVQGDREIKLTRHDETAAGTHHYLPLAWVASVGDAVRLDRSAAQARREWRTELPGGAESGPGGVGA